MTKTDGNEYRDLWAAVIGRAIDDLPLGGMWGRRANAWFNSKATSVGSYLWVCQSLGYNPRIFREAVYSKVTLPPQGVDNPEKPKDYSMIIKITAVAGYENMSAREIAKAIGMSVNYVYQATKRHGLRFRRLKVGRPPVETV